MLSVRWCLLLLALVSGTTHAFSNGLTVTRSHTVMDGACISGNLRPHHGTNASKPADKPLHFPLNGAPPFRLTTNKNRYGPGDVINVVLSSPGRRKFKGFFITVDMEDAMMGMGKGKFERTNGLAAPAKYCVDGIIHTSGSLKPSVTVKYRAPAQFTHGTLQFKATVVVDRTHFYTGILSAPVRPRPNTLTQTQFNQRSLKNSGGMAAMFNNLGSAGGAGGGMGGGVMDTFLSNFMSNMRQNQAGGGAGGAGGGAVPPMNFNLGNFRPGQG